MFRTINALMDRVTPLQRRAETECHGGRLSPRYGQTLP
jgi:hypothetical protein